MGNSLGASEHTIGELGTEGGCTQKIYVQSEMLSVSRKQNLGLLRVMSTMSQESHAWQSLEQLPMASSFRKIDVDAYDEDVLLETELYDPDPRGPQQVVEDAKAKAASVRTSLSK